MSHFDSCQLTLIWLVRITLNWQPWWKRSFISFSFLCWCDILYQLICRGKTTGLSSEPARWSCGNCQRMSDFDSCQSNRTHTDGLHNWKASQVVQDLLWHLTSAYMKCVYGWADVRYVITKFSRMDSLPNFLTYGAPQACASCMRELRYKLEVECGKCHNNMPFDKQIDFSA